MKRSAPLGSLFLLLSAALPHALAGPVTYTLTGYVQATAQGNQVNTSFTWTVQADTDGITNPSSGGLQNPAVSNTIVFTGAGTTTIAGVTVSLNKTTGQVTFGTASGGIGLTATQLQSWDLASPIGPLNGPNVLVSGTITTDSGTAITLTGVANANNGPSPTFQAAQPPPTVSNLVNAASNIVAGLPNSAIAQGAIFVAYGTGLGPSHIVIAPTPFQSTTLSSTSVAITVNGTTVNAPLYYTSTGQVSGLLPSNTPAGTGTVTITYNNRTGPAAPITVVPNNVGVFTHGANGQGSAIVTYPDYSLVSPAKAAGCGAPLSICGAANPGDTLILWATGLGPVSGDDVSGAGLGQNMPNIPLQVLVGGVSAPVAYQGRSGCCVGEDQIVFTVPNNVATGCAVPLAVQIGSLVSNVTIMPIAKGSRTCTPTNPGIALVGADVFEAGTSALPVNIASIQLSRDPNPPGQPGQTDNAKFQFLKVLSVPAALQPFAVSYLDDLAPGTCMASNNLNPSSNYGLSSGTSSADAGSAFTVTGPSGKVTVNGNPGNFSAVLSNTGNFLNPGTFTIAGTGGADIGVIGSSFNIPADPVLTSPANPAAISAASRSAGIPVTWTGGDDLIQITVQTATDNTNTTGATVQCNVAAFPGKFTVPPYALLSLPPGNAGAFFQFRQVAEFALSASKLLYGEVQAFNASNVWTNFTLK